MIRIAVVGTGIIANAHFSAIDKIDEYSLACIAEVKENIAKQIGEKYGVPYYTDYKEMAEKEEFDAVILNLPHFLHCEATVYFLEKGIHVLCEKPMANTVEECDRMIEASEKSGAKLYIGHIMRHFASNKIIKKIIADKSLGELCMYTEVRTISYFNDERPKWFFDKKLAGGGLLMNYGAHTFDLLRYLTDGEITDVDADIGNLMDKSGVEAHAQIKLKIDGRIPCSVTFCGYPSFQKEEQIFYFTKGALLQINGKNLFICSTPNGEFLPYDHEKTDPFKTQLEEFVKYIRNEACNLSDGASARKTIEVITKIYSQDNI